MKLFEKERTVQRLEVLCGDQSQQLAFYSANKSRAGSIADNDITRERRRTLKIASGKANDIFSEMYQRDLNRPESSQYHHLESLDNFNTYLSPKGIANQTNESGGELVLALGIGLETDTDDKDQ